MAEMKDLREQLKSVADADHSTWARVAHETSGAFAAWSVRLEPTPGPLAETSDVLARAASLHRRNVKPSPIAKMSMRGPASLLMMVAAGPGSKTGQALLMRQLLNMTRALFLAQQATSQARTARQLSHTIQTRLAEVVKTLPSIENTTEDESRTPGQPAGTGRTPTSPVPGQLELPSPASAPPPETMYGPKQGRGNDIER